MITGIVLAKNEELNIKDCIESIDFCDQILVIDDNSSDNTVKIAQELGAQVIHHKMRNFSLQRNFALEKAHSKWVLFLDADERVSKELAKEIQNVLRVGKHDGYLIERKDIWMGKRLVGGESGSALILRLGKKSVGKWDRRVHETWLINGKIGKLKHPIYHLPHLTIFSFVKKIGEYSSLHASENKSEGKSPSLSKIVIYPIGKFMKNYIVKKGYKDGVNGFVSAMLMSFHSFLAWSQLWISKNKK